MTLEEAVAPRARAERENNIIVELPQVTRGWERCENKGQERGRVEGRRHSPMRAKK